MSELLGPTYMFDITLGSIVNKIDTDPEAITLQMQKAGLTDEAINNTTIHFSSEARPLPAPSADEIRVNAAGALPREIVVHIGSYAFVHKHLPRGIASALMTLKLSEDLAHEIEHLRQYEDGELTPELLETETDASREDQPWEQKGRAEGDAYMKAFNSGGSEPLAWALFKSA